MDIFIHKFYVSDIIDNSGMAFQYTSKLRKFDAGVLEVGLEYTNRMAIPPHMSDFPLSGYCMPECTERVEIFIYK